MSDPGHDDDGLSPTARAQRSAAPYINAAWKVAGGVIIGALAGWFVDGKLQTGPWGLLVGLMLGMGAGFYSLMRALAATGRKR